MRWLQALVAIMGIMIVLGVTVIGVTIAHRLSVHRLSTAADPASVRAAQPATPLQLSLKLPRGAHVASVAGVGGRVVLQVIAPDQSEFIDIVDPDTGRLIHQIALDNH